MKEKVINFKSKTDLENSVNEAEARFHEQICDVAETLVGDNTRILLLPDRAAPARRPLRISFAESLSAWESMPKRFRSTISTATI